VNISSIGGKIAVPHLAPYSASKFALTGFSDAIRAELDPYGIRVTTVAPGLMRTGSPVNAQFKGQHEAEYAWFKIASSLPALTIAAERAARKILDACRYGDPSLTITQQARAAAAANVIAPASVARAMMLVTRMLPAGIGLEGNTSKRGLASEAKSRWTPSVVTRLADHAALANNEI
jgi:short-subunit dehydrogenase